MSEVNHPENIDQLVDLVQGGLASDKPFSISGQNTRAGFGNASQTEVNICADMIKGIIEYDPAELVMQAKAGTPLSDIEDALSGNNQHLAFEPPKLGRLYDKNSGSGTIGGAFMANLSGPRRFTAGAARDHILGVKAVSGRGEIYKSGGNVIKNVTGYDLSKLLTGSWGTLSIVTELSFKVLPAPPVSISIALEGLEINAALGLLSSLAQSALDLTGLAFIPGETLTSSNAEVFSSHIENLLLIRLEGSSTSVRERINALHQMVPESMTAIQYEDEQSRCLWKIIGDLDLLNSAGKENCIVKLSAGACIWLSLENDKAPVNIRQLRAALANNGGSVVLYRAPDIIKQQVGIFSDMSDGLWALTHRLKDSFDPKNILNPHRLFQNQ
jgi:glycolate oxidase FAD binding subunit